MTGTIRPVFHSIPAVRAVSVYRDDSEERRREEQRRRREEAAARDVKARAAAQDIGERAAIASEPEADDGLPHIDVTV